MASRDLEARRAYARRYYAQHRDHILARRRARRAARSKSDLERDEAQRKKRNVRYRRANLPPPRVATLRAQGRERARRRRATGNGKSDYWRNPEAARLRQRRYYQRHRMRLRESKRERDRARYKASRESLLSARRRRYASMAT